MEKYFVKSVGNPVYPWPLLTNLEICILWQEFSQWIIYYLAGKITLLVGDTLVNFGDILPERSESSACWDMGGNSHLTWLSSNSLYIYTLVYRT